MTITGHAAGHSTGSSNLSSQINYGTQNRVSSASAKGDHCPVHNHHSHTSTSSTQNRSTAAAGKSSTSMSSSFSHNQQQQQMQMQSSKTQRVVRTDNLSIGKGQFDNQTSSKSTYGHFQTSDRVVPVRSSHTSNISIGSYSPQQVSSSSYSKTYVSQKVVPCPATLLETGKSPFRYQRQSSSHRFYMPNVSN